MSLKTTNLRGNASFTEISAKGMYLHAPGLHGTVIELDTKTESPTRGSGITDGLHESLKLACKGEDVSLLGQFEIQIEKDDLKGADKAQTRAAGVTRQTSLGEDAMVLKTPKIQDQMDCAVLHVDENGEHRWVLPEDHNPKSEFTFLLPREGAPAIPEENADNVRGKITKGIRRIVKVFAWISDEIIGLGAMAIVKKWENNKRPYSIDLLQPNSLDAHKVDWDKFEGEKSLLLVHGTFSSWQASYPGFLKSKVINEINEMYNGRIIAFNHPTLHHNPAENVQHFLERIPEGLNLNLDVITHSRGTLVARELVERFDDLNPGGRSVNVDKAIFVAGPNQGTILTDKDNWIKLIDSYTNLLTSLPDNTVTIILESIITFIKVIGGGSLQALPGLQSMMPTGEYLERLNKAGDISSTYYAMGTRYAPFDDNLLKRFGKQVLMKVLTKIFEEDCDMVVPTQGCFNTPGDPIPDARKKLYELEADIHHLNFFEHENVNYQLKKWLSA